MARCLGEACESGGSFQAKGLVELDAFADVLASGVGWLKGTEEGVDDAIAAADFQGCGRFVVGHQHAVAEYVRDAELNMAQQWFAQL